VTSRAERSAQRLLVAALLLLAIWTLCYQVALTLSIPSTPTLVVAVAGWAGALAVLSSRRRTDPEPRALHGPVPWRTVLVAVAVTAVVWALVAVRHRLAATLLGAAAAAAYLVLRWRARQRMATHDEAAPDPSAPRTGRLTTGSGRLWTLGWVLALVDAVLASVIVHPNADDAYFVSVSAWVADRGTFPVRDTMLSDQVFPGLSSHTPNVSSIEGLYGAVAHLLGISAGTIVYVVAVPILVLLAGLALTWLVAEAAIPAAPLGLAAATVGLWMSGEASAFGHAPLRMWQGKVALVAVCLPLLLVFAMRLVERGGRREHLLLGSSVVAAVGLSNTSVFLVPLILAGIGVAVVVVRGLRPAVRVAAWMAYPLAVGVVVVLVSRHVSPGTGVSAIAFTVPHQIPDPFRAVPGSGVGPVTSTVLAIGLGWMGLRDRLLRAASLGLLVAAAAVLVPPVQHLVSSAAGIGPVIWRVWYAVPVPLLMAGVVGAAADAVRSRAGALRVLPVVAAGLVVALVPIPGGSINLPDNPSTTWAGPTTWKLAPGSLAQARFADAVSRPGDTVLAPRLVSWALLSLTTRVHPVLSRLTYVAELSPYPAAHAADRRYLEKLANGGLTGSPDPTRVGAALTAVGVDTVCLTAPRRKVLTLFQELGFRSVGGQGGVLCLRR